MRDSDGILRMHFGARIRLVYNNFLYWFPKYNPNLTTEEFIELDLKVNGPKYRLNHFIDVNKERGKSDEWIKNHKYYKSLKKQIAEMEENVEMITNGQI